MSLYESVAARLIGTPLQRPAEWLRYMRGARFRREHPELTEWFLEGGRADEYVRRVVAHDTDAIDIGCHIGSFLQTIVTLAPHGATTPSSRFRTRPRGCAANFPT